MIRIVWEEAALKRHEEWAFSILIEHGPQHLDSFLENIDNAIQIISNNAFVGTEFKLSSRPKLYRFVTSQGYSVFYELDFEENPKEGTIVSIVRGQDQI